MLNRFYNSVIKEALADNIIDPVELSIALIVTALNPIQYRFERSQINQKYYAALSSMYNESGSTPKLAWLISRLFYTRHILKERDLMGFALITQVSSDLLKSNFPKDQYTLWAMGYFALDKNVYNYYKNLNDLYLEPVTNVNDKIWGELLNMQACAEHKDKTQYRLVMDRLLTLTGKNSLLDAIDTLPMHDYRLWAYCIAAESLLKFKKEVYKYEALGIIEVKNKGMTESMNINDKAIATVFHEKLQDIYGI